MSESLINIKNVSFTYPNGDVALDTINFEIPKGKKIALLGGNGAGKSTLMLLLNGILKPTAGILDYEGENYKYSKKALRNLRSNIGLLFPESDYQLIAPTVYEEISFGLLNLFSDEEIVRQKVEKAIQDFSLQDIINKSPHQLSTGQKKRVCLAAILAMEPELLICDEPTSNLDPVYSKKIFKYLDALNQKGKSILIATHDVNHAYSWADYVIIMNKGQILTSGKPQDIFREKKLLEKANLSQPILIDILKSLDFNFKNKEIPKTIDELKVHLENKN